jgi:phytoene desaturase
MSRSVSIVGAGLGGLAAAIRLAKAGFKVTVFEKNAQAGGKMSEYQQGKYRFDTGPSLLTMSFVVDELFHYAGFKREDFLDFVPIEPICRYFFPDGSIFDAYDKSEKMIESLKKFAPAETNHFLNYMKYCEELYNIAGEVFLYTPIRELRKIFKPENFPLFLKLHRLDAWRTVYESLKTFFRDERLIQLFARYTTYNGSDPYRAPATLNIIPYVEYNLGAYYIKGGMYRLVDALLTLCEKVGVQIKTTATVRKIWHEDAHIKGLFLHNERVESDFVLCNSDVVTTFETLIDGFDDRKRKLKKLEPSLSGMVFLWNVNKSFSQLAHHNIFFSENYQREFLQMFRDRAPAEDPTVYVAITSRTDRSHAPEGCENWFVLVNMPYLDSRQKWPEFIKWVRQQVLGKLQYHGHNVKPHIVDESIFTPETFAQFYGANRGSIYGLSSNSRFSTFLRPPNRDRDIKGLYFAGGSTHPGGGIPLVLLSGKLAAELIMER